MPKLLDELENVGVYNPIICTSINKIGFRMSGGIEAYEKVLETRQARVIAMQVVAAGAISLREAIEYVCSLPNIESILFGASSKTNIEETVSYIKKNDLQLQCEGLLTG